MRRPYGIIRKLGFALGLLVVAWFGAAWAGNLARSMGYPAFGTAAGSGYSDASTGWKIAVRIGSTVAACAWSLVVPAAVRASGEDEVRAGTRWRTTVRLVVAAAVGLCVGAVYVELSSFGAGLN